MMFTLQTEGGMSHISDIINLPSLFNAEILSMNPMNASDTVSIILADTSLSSLENVLRLIKFGNTFIRAQEIVNVVEAGLLLGLPVLGNTSKQFTFERYVASGGVGDDVICIRYHRSKKVKNIMRKKLKRIMNCNKN